MKLAPDFGHSAYLCLLCTLVVACTGGDIAPVSVESAAAPSRYTRLAAGGKAVKGDIDSARCVRDKETGLVWELKTDDGGIHDKDNDYRWGGLGAEAVGSLFFDDWNSLLAATNGEKLCGFSDWRVPSIDELNTLIKRREAGPQIAVDFFPHTLPAPYWSTSAYQGYPEHGQNVHFGTGDAYYYNGYRGNALAVRLVRGGQ